MHVYSVRIQAFPDYANKMEIKFFRQKNAQILLDSQNKAKVALWFLKMLCFVFRKAYKLRNRVCLSSTE